MINLTPQVNHFAFPANETSDQLIRDQRALGQAQLCDDLCRVLLDGMDLQAAMRIVRHDQAVPGPEDAVIGDFEHPVPAVQEGHGLQVAAQGSPVLAFDTIGAVGY